jgi:hypothetical protein
MYGLALASPGQTIEDCIGDAWQRDIRPKVSTGKLVCSFDSGEMSGEKVDTGGGSQSSSMISNGPVRRTETMAGNNRDEVVRMR